MGVNAHGEKIKTLKNYFFIETLKNILMQGLMCKSSGLNLFLLAYPQVDKRKLMYPSECEKAFYDISIVKILN